MNAPIAAPEQLSVATPGLVRAPTAAHQQLTVIRPAVGWQPINFRELWRFRGLIYHFIWRDVKVRYKHTLLGIGWAVLQPLMMMLVFTTYFSLIRGAASESGAYPYPLYIATGIMPWLFFSSATIAASQSVLNSEHLISKIYFPRLVVTFSSVGAYVVDFVITFGLLFVLMACYSHPPTFSILLAPMMAGFLVLACLAMGVSLAALNITYKDFKHLIPFMMQLWFFATPIIFLQVADYADAAPVSEKRFTDFANSLVASDKAPPGQSVPENPPATLKTNSSKQLAHPLALGKTGLSAGGEPDPTCMVKGGPSDPGDDEILVAKEPPVVEIITERISQHQVKFRSKYEALMLFNPVSSIIVSYRASVLGTDIPWGYLAISVSFFLCLFLVGCFYYRRVEDRFVDII
jgi:lipopolysaccharide transport system permease protein